MKTDEVQTPGLRAAILAGCIVAFLGFGFAASFGVFLVNMHIMAGACQLLGGRHASRASANNAY